MVSATCLIPAPAPEVALSISGLSRSLPFHSAEGPRVEVESCVGNGLVPFRSAAGRWPTSCRPLQKRQAVKLVGNGLAAADSAVPVDRRSTIPWRLAGSLAWNGATARPVPSAVTTVQSAPESTPPIARRSRRADDLPEPDGTQCATHYIPVMFSGSPRSRSCILNHSPYDDGQRFDAFLELERKEDAPWSLRRRNSAI